MNGIVTNLYQEKRTPVTCCWKTEEILKLQKCHFIQTSLCYQLIPYHIKHLTDAERN